MGATTGFPVQGNNTDPECFHDAYMKKVYKHNCSFYYLSELKISQQSFATSHRHKAHKNLLTGELVSRSDLIEAGLSKTQTKAFFAALDGKAMTDYSLSDIAKLDNIAMELSAEGTLAAAQKEAKNIKGPSANDKVIGKYMIPCNDGSEAFMFHTKSTTGSSKDDATEAEADTPASVKKIVGRPMTKADLKVTPEVRQAYKADTFALTNALYDNYKNPDAPSLPNNPNTMVKGDDFEGGKYCEQHQRVCEVASKDCYCTGPIFDPKLGFKAMNDLKEWVPEAVKFYVETKDLPQNADGRFTKFGQVVDHLRDIVYMLRLGMNEVIQSYQEAHNLLVSKKKSWKEAHHFVVAQSKTLWALSREFMEKAMADIPADWVDKDAHLAAVYTLYRAGESYSEALYQYHMARFYLAKKSKEYQIACFRFEKLNWASNNLDELFGYEEEAGKDDFRMAHLEKMIRWLRNLQATVEHFPIYERKKEGGNEPKKMIVHTLPSGKKVELSLWRICTPDHEKAATTHEQLKRAKKVAKAETDLMKAGFAALEEPPILSEEEMAVSRANAAKMREAHAATKATSKAAAVKKTTAPKAAASKEAVPEAPTPTLPGKNAAKNKKTAEKRKAKKKAKAAAAAAGKSVEGEESDGGESAA